MRNLGRLAAMAALVVVAIGSSGSAMAADKARQAIDKVNQAWLAAYAAHDSAKVASLYAPDASVFAPNTDRANGREAIRKVWQGFMDAGVTNVSLHTTDVDAHGGAAIESGEVALDVPGKDGKLAHVSAKYVVAWKRGKGDWQLYRDIWNDNPPR